MLANVFFRLGTNATSGSPSLTRQNLVEGEGPASFLSILTTVTKGEIGQGSKGDNAETTLQSMIVEVLEDLGLEEEDVDTLLALLLTELKGHTIPEANAYLGKLQDDTQGHLVETSETSETTSAKILRYIAEHPMVPRGSESEVATTKSQPQVVVSVSDKEGTEPLQGDTVNKSSPPHGKQKGVYAPKQHAVFERNIIRDLTSSPVSVTSGSDAVPDTGKSLGVNGFRFSHTQEPLRVLSQPQNTIILDDVRPVAQEWAIPMESSDEVSSLVLTELASEELRGELRLALEPATQQVVLDERGEAIKAVEAVLSKPTDTVLQETELVRKEVVAETPFLNGRPEGEPKRGSPAVVAPLLGVTEEVTGETRKPVETGLNVQRNDLESTDFTGTDKTEEPPTEKGQEGTMRSVINSVRPEPTASEEPTPLKQQAPLNVSIDESDGQVNQDIRMQNLPRTEQVSTIVKAAPQPVEEDIISQIVERIHGNVSSERGEIRIQLKPDSLGELRIKVAVEHGVITAEFIAENQAVKEIIGSHLNHLRSNLEEMGMNVSQLSVNVGSGFRERQNQSRFNKELGSSRQISNKRVNSGKFTENLAVPPRAVSADGHVDLRA